MILTLILLTGILSKSALHLLIKFDNMLIISVALVGWYTNEFGLGDFKKSVKEVYDGGIAEARELPPKYTLNVLTISFLSVMSLPLLLKQWVTSFNGY